MIKDNMNVMQDSEEVKKRRIKEALQQLRGSGAPKPMADVGEEIELPEFEAMPEEEVGSVPVGGEESPMLPKKKFKLKAI
jgi:hypothetical protein